MRFSSPDVVTQKPPPASRIQSVERGLDILEFVSAGGGDVTLAEIARATGLTKTTCHRLLASLESRGYVRRHGTRPEFALGFHALALGQRFLNQISFYGQALDQLKVLRDVSEETAALAIRTGSRRVFVAQVESTLPVRHAVPLGIPLPLTAGASGKAILAFLTDQDLEEILREMDQGLLPQGPSLREDLQSELVRIRAQRFAVSDEEVVSGSAALASPIFSIHGEAVAAFSLTGPLPRFSLSRRLELAEKVVGAARAISGIREIPTAELSNSSGGPQGVVDTR